MWLTAPQPVSTRLVPTAASRPRTQDPTLRKSFIASTPFYSCVIQNTSAPDTARTRLLHPVNSPALWPNRAPVYETDPANDASGHTSLPNGICTFRPKPL